MSAQTADGGREIVITRVIAAPRALVFDAFTDAAHISNWWGPHGFTTTTSEMDVRPGGTWRFVMHGPDGTDHPNRVVYDEVVRPERLAYAHDNGEDDDPRRFRASATVQDEGGRTRVTLRMEWASPAVRESMRQFGVVEGGEQTLERLAAHLARAT
jgi:uncharacterized protein YndB with AHSA1/START domain